jgi:signal peptidase I
MNDKASIFGYRAYVIDSESMTPEIKLNALVIVKTNNLKIKNGDIIAFRSPAMGNAVVIHRISDITESGIITKGDAVSEVDQYSVHPNEVIGLCVNVNNSISNYIGKVRTVPGFILLLLLPLIGIIIVVNAIVMMISLNKKKKTKKKS